MINRKSYLKRSKKAIRKVSKRRAIALRQYRIARDQYLREHPKCESGFCGQPSVAVHHKKGIGENLSKVEFFMAVCFDHHAYIETHREWAREQGYLLDRIGHD